MRSERRLNRIALAKRAIPARPEPMGGFLSRRFCGLRGRERPGAIFRFHSATGIRYSSAFGVGSSAELSRTFSRHYRQTPTLNMSWSMARLSLSTAMDKAQKGDQKSGDRQEPRRSDDENPGPGRCGLSNLVCFLLMPGQRGETTGVAALIEGVPFGAFLGDKAYDADWLRKDLAVRGIEAVIPARAKRRYPASHDAEKYKWRRLAQEFLLQTQRIQAYRDASLQDRRKLRCHDLPRCFHHPYTMNVKKTESD